MKGALSLIFVAASLAVASGGLLESTPAVLALQRTIARGIVLNVGDTMINVGLVGVPVDAICSTEIPEACRICHIDCQQAHGASTGKCARIDGKMGCRCDYSTPTPATMSCPSYTNNTVALLDPLLDAVLTTFLRTRYEKVLCGSALDQGVSCGEVECPNNHAAVGGECVAANTKDDVIDTSRSYCYCNY